MMLTAFVWLSLVAQPAPVAKVHLVEPQVLHVEGVEGLWLPMDFARELLKQDGLVQIQQKHIEALEAISAQREAQVAALREVARLDDSRTLITQLELDGVKKDAQHWQKLAEERGAWYRSPSLWGMLGLLAGSSLLIFTVD